MGANPLLVGGTERVDSIIIEETGGRVITKVGAEGVHSAVILDAGIGIAIKVEDGNARAQQPALIHLLQQLDALPNQLPAPLADLLRRPVRNTRGEIVGETYVKVAKRKSRRSLLAASN
jgi:L-asparaginase II